MRNLEGNPHLLCRVGGLPVTREFSIYICAMQCCLGCSLVKVVLLWPWVPCGLGDGKERSICRHVTSPPLACSPPARSATLSIHYRTKFGRLTPLRCNRCSQDVAIARRALYLPMHLSHKVLQFIPIPLWPLPPGRCNSQERFGGRCSSRGLSDPQRVLHGGAWRLCKWLHWQLLLTARSHADGVGFVCSSGLEGGERGGGGCRA
jgi:hypothetical protein